MNITSQLADFVASTPTEQIPSSVRHHAVRTLVNWCACALAGARDPAVDTALNAIRSFAGPAQASILGRPERLDVLHAALINGISSHVLDFDDTHLATLVHPSGPVLSALLALSQYRPTRGTDFVDALVLGIETECRIALGLGRSHYDTGWHVTSTAGVCGAAAAAGRLLGLDQRHMAWALGIAATQAAGLREMFGSMCKSLHAGKAAQNGLGAALMAQAGFTSSERILEAPRGMLSVMSVKSDAERILEGIGSSWETTANTFKPYACGLVIHPVIDACRALVAADHPDSDTIAEVSLQVHPLVLELTGKPRPASGLEAKFSVFHCAAATLLDGNSLLSHFSDAYVRNPEVAALRDRVVAEVRSDFRKDEARVVLTLNDGSRREIHVEHALGSLERPMTENELSSKFRQLAEGVLAADRVDAALQRCWGVDSPAPAAEIAVALTPHSIA
ncbi:MmgE/PrpD family protein [Cupriavidus sp. CP313]